LESRPGSDVTRPWAMRGWPGDAHQALLAAERAAPEEIRAQPKVRELASELPYEPTTPRLSGLRDLSCSQRLRCLSARRPPGQATASRSWIAWGYAIAASLVGSVVRHDLFGELCPCGSTDLPAPFQATAAAAGHPCRQDAARHRDLSCLNPLLFQALVVTEEDVM
jgi:hypothetical protein